MANLDCVAQWFFDVGRDVMDSRRAAALIGVVVALSAGPTKFRKILT
jgi:hypothetical protein